VVGEEHVFALLNLYICQQESREEALLLILQTLLILGAGGLQRGRQRSQTA